MAFTNVDPSGRPDAVTHSPDARALTSELDDAATPARGAAVLAQRLVW